MTITQSDIIDKHQLYRDKIEEANRTWPQAVKFVSEMTDDYHSILSRYMEEHPENISRTPAIGSDQVVTITMKGKSKDRVVKLVILSTASNIVKKAQYVIEDNILHIIYWRNLADQALLV